MDKNELQALEQEDIKEQVIKFSNLYHKFDLNMELINSYYIDYVFETLRIKKFFKKNIQIDEETESKIKAIRKAFGITTLSETIRFIVDVNIVYKNLNKVLENDNN